VAAPPRRNRDLIKKIDERNRNPAHSGFADRCELVGHAIGRTDERIAADRVANKVVAPCGIFLWRKVVWRDVAQRHHGFDCAPIGAIDDRIMEIIVRFLLGRPTDHLTDRVERDLAAVSLRFLLDLLNRPGIALKGCPRAEGRGKERVTIA
jgi:hypothetical protein